MECDFPRLKPNSPTFITARLKPCPSEPIDGSKMNAAVQPAVFGATGYSGLELVRLLARHHGVKKPLLFQRNGEGGVAPI